jgi:hypothetical protein
MIGGTLENDALSALDWMTIDPLGPDEVKACLASVMFILTNAAKHGVAADTLSQELQQLGLPKGKLQSYCVVLVQCQDWFNGFARLRYGSRQERAGVWHSLKPLF